MIGCAIHIRITRLLRGAAALLDSDDAVTDVLQLSAHGRNTALKLAVLRL
jgi:hypothetical protein